MKRVVFKILSGLAMAVFRLMSFLPIVGGFGKQMYASCLFGEASGLYFGKRYSKAVDAYKNALAYSEGMEELPPFCVAFEQAYQALGNMYENGLGVEKDELLAEEYYLRAGSRGNTAYEHKVATKSWYEAHRK